MDKEKNTYHFQNRGHLSVSTIFIMFYFLKIHGEYDKMLAFVKCGCFLHSVLFCVHKNSTHRKSNQPGNTSLLHD